MREIYSHPRNLVTKGSLIGFFAFRKNKKSRLVRHSFLKPHVALYLFFPSN
jgi:hypothetical protein